MLCLRPLCKSLRDHQEQLPLAGCPRPSWWGGLQGVIRVRPEVFIRPHRPIFNHMKGGLCTGMMLLVKHVRENDPSFRAIELGISPSLPKPPGESSKGACTVRSGRPLDNISKCELGGVGPPGVVSVALQRCFGATLACGRGKVPGLCPRST